MFDVVVAADLDWGIGKHGGLPWPKLTGDLAHFKRVTSAAPEGTRNAIVMGRKTWDSKEVARRPLPRRLNIIVSRSELAVPEGVIAVRSLDAALAAASADADATRESQSALDPPPPRDPATRATSSAGAPVYSTFVVGGAGLLLEGLDHAALRWIYLTRVEGRFGCDVAIPDLDVRGWRADAAWDGACSGEDNGVKYRIERLSRSAS